MIIFIIILFWCKFNSLVLENFFIQKVIIRTGRSLHYSMVTSMVTSNATDLHRRNLSLGKCIITTLCF